MRKIVFKGKTVDTGAWVIGLPVRNIYGQLCIQPDNQGYCVLVEPETVGQYTGLTDKDGRRIFEGDCLNHMHNVVEYSAGGYSVAGDRPLWSMAKDSRIVGNIHDEHVKGE